MVAPLVDGVGDSPASLDTSWEVTGFLVKQPRCPPPRWCRCYHRQGDPVLVAVLKTVRVTVSLTRTEGVRVEVTARNFGARVVEGASCRTWLWTTPMGIPWRLFPRRHRHLHPRLLLLCRGHLLKFSPALRLERKRNTCYRRSCRWKANLLLM